MVEWPNPCQEEFHTYSNKIYNFPAKVKSFSDLRNKKLDIYLIPALKTCSTKNDTYEKQSGSERVKHKVLNKKKFTTCFV